MSAATDSRASEGLGTSLRYFEIWNSYRGSIADNVNLPKGTIAARLLADTATSPAIYPFTTGASKEATGVVDVGGDNTLTGHIAGRFPVAVTQRTAKFVDLNAGGGSAIVATDVFKPAYGADNQTVSKLASDGEHVGMITGVDADGGPIVGVGPMFKALSLAYQQGTAGAALPPMNVTAVKTGVYAAQVGDLVRVNPTGGGFAPTLPEVGAWNKGLRIAFKNVSASNNAVTVTPDGADTIDGAATFVMNQGRQYVEFVSDGTSDWMVA
jgi:hypothetical protein